MCTMCMAGTWRGQKRVPDPSKLELLMADAENWTQVICQEQQMLLTADSSL